MKSKKLKKLIQKPLRFHHQDIHEELNEIKEKLNYVICQMQNLQQRIDIESQEPKLRVPQYDDLTGG
tara:strand:- start:1440 stop:1640 length:201 start_codon:yes stop_codon:yes gene_type:complete